MSYLRSPTSEACSSSSFCWASVTNAPNVLQPHWFIVLPLDVPDLTASLLLWGPSGQRWRCLWTFLFSSVPTFATSRLQEILAAKGGNTWARNGRWILPENARLPRNIQVSFTRRKSTTWDRRLYFPSEGRRADDFFALKNPTASVRFEPANFGTEGRHATSRPPKPLRSRLLLVIVLLNEQNIDKFSYFQINSQRIKFTRVFYLVWCGVKLVSFSERKLPEENFDRQ